MFRASAKSFRHSSFAGGLYSFVGYSVVNWTPSFLVRSHGMSTARIGFWLAMIVGVGGGIGNYLGGTLADRWQAREPRARVYLPALAVAASFPFGFVIYTTSNTTLALALLVIPTALGLMYQAPTFAVTQSLATPRMRATAAAVLLFVLNIVGLSLGPAVTGALSDALAPRYGADSLRWALLIVSTLFVWSAIHFYLAGRTLEADVARAAVAARKSL